MGAKAGPRMELQGGGFRLGGEPFFIYSGEMHYFRIPKGQWRARLKAAKAAGLNTVSTYIPWIWHEPEEGKVDVTGSTAPERDVLGFIEAARQEKLHVMVRVGPVSNAELLHEGIPDWLIHGYRDVFVTGTRDVGNLPHVTILSYLHPVFQEKVGRWYDALLPAVAERQVHRGGNILGVQLCNEVAMVHWLQKGADYKDHVNRMFREFLRETHGSVGALNAAHKASYKSFDEVPQPKVEPVDPDRLAVYVDWALFYRRYYATYFQTLSTRARDHGLEVPFFCNIPQFYDYDVRGRGNWAPMTTSMFRDFPLLTPNLVFGGAYQMRHLDFENFHDVALTTEITRLLNTAEPTAAPARADLGSGRLPSLPPFEVKTDSETPVMCAELQTGIMRDRPRLYPHQVMLNIKTSVSQGLAGINAYMLAGGVNPPGLGAFGTYHDWQSPIGPKGELRPHLEPMREFGRFVKWAGPLLARTRKAVDTAFGFYFPYWGTEYWSGPWNDAHEGQRTYLWYDGLARLVQLAGYSYNFADLQRTPLDVLLKFPSLWVYSLDFMDGDTQRKLADYVKGGGKLILNPRLPSKDLLNGRETSLADGLGLSLSETLPGNRYTLKGTDYWVQGPIQLTQGGTGLVPLEKGDAVTRKKVGKGEVIVAGVGLPHVFDHFRDWVRGWGDALGLGRRVDCDPWDVQAVVREAEDFGFLFVFNYHFTPKEASLSLRLPGSRETVRLPGKGRLRLPAFEGLILPLNVPLADGVRLAYATAEPGAASADAKGVRLSFRAAPGTEVEAALVLPRPPKSARAEGKKVSPVRKGGRYVFSFTVQKAGDLEVVLSGK